LSPSAGSITAENTKINALINTLETELSHLKGLVAEHEKEADLVSSVLNIDIDFSLFSNELVLSTLPNNNYTVAIL